VKEIIEILKQTEKDTKSVFGTYGSQRMKDWQEISRLYEKNATYLAETAQIFVRNVNYEIPGVRKQMARLEQQADETQKRAHDLNKPESQILADHSALLEQLGVKGDNLHADEDNLKQHLRRHNDEGKLFICSECGKSCKNSRALIGHKRYSHSNVIYTCEQCGKTFKKDISLKVG